MKVILAALAATALSATSVMACGWNKTAGGHDTMTTASISAPMTTVEQLPAEQTLETNVDTETEAAED